MPYISPLKLKQLEREINKLRRETVELTQQKCEAEIKLFKAYGMELEETIVKRLNLTPEQGAELGLIFSIEMARLCGVPEEEILHTQEEVEAYFAAEES